MKRIFIIVLFISAFVFIQCNKCREKNLGDINFSQTDLNIIPYNGNEVLTYKDSIGDSLVFTAQNKWTESNPHYENDVTSPDDCPGDYFMLEQYDLRFFKSSSDIFPYMRFDLDFGDPFSDNIKKYIYINVQYTDPQGWSYENKYEFDNLTLFNSTNGSSLTFTDSLNIGSKKFFSVYSLGKSDQSINIIYYTISKGIVGFKTNQGHLWFLQN